MRAFIVKDFITGLRVKKRNFAGLMSGEDKMWDVREGAYRRLRTDRVEF